MLETRQIRTACSLYQRCHDFFLYRIDRVDRIMVDSKKSIDLVSTLGRFFANLPSSHIKMLFTAPATCFRNLSVSQDKTFGIFTFALKIFVVDRRKTILFRTGGQGHPTPIHTPTQPQHSNIHKRYQKAVFPTFQLSP